MDFQNAGRERQIILILLVSLYLWGTMEGLSLVYAGVSPGTVQAANTPPTIFTQPDTSQNMHLVVHTVQRGETLSFLAQKYRTEVSTLQRTNRLKSTRLYPGQKLVVFSSAQPHPPAHSPLNAQASSNSQHEKRASRSPAKGLHFIWPLQGEISSGFGYRKRPMGGSHGRFHDGIDIKAVRGTPVRAAEDGEVVVATYYKGYGRVVILKHQNDFSTLYAHNRRLLVRPGMQVKQGDIIARSGNSGRSSGPHLHFEIRQGDKALDPLKFLD